MADKPDATTYGEPVEANTPESALRARIWARLSVLPEWIGSESFKFKQCTLANGVRMQAYPIQVDELIEQAAGDIDAALLANVGNPRNVVAYLANYCSEEAYCAIGRHGHHFGVAPTVEVRCRYQWLEAMRTAYVCAWNEREYVHDNIDLRREWRLTEDLAAGTLEVVPKEVGA